MATITLQPTIIRLRLNTLKTYFSPLYRMLISKLVGNGVLEFYEKWSNLLPGGIQFTFYESNNRLPPWESRAVYGRR